AGEIRRTGDDQQSSRCHPEPQRSRLLFTQLTKGSLSQHECVYAIVANVVARQIVGSNHHWMRLKPLVHSIERISKTSLRILLGGAVDVGVRSGACLAKRRPVRNTFDVDRRDPTEGRLFVVYHDYIELVLEAVGSIHFHRSVRDNLVAHDYLNVRILSGAHERGYFVRLSRSGRNANLFDVVSILGIWPIRRGAANYELSAD